MTKKNKPYNLACLPARELNFQQVFVGQRRWYPVRMAAHRVPNVRYVALYRGFPVSAYTHYAEVVGMSRAYPGTYRTIYVDEPIALPQPVELGRIHVNNIRKLFYSTLEELKSVNTVEELIR